MPFYFPEPCLNGTNPLGLEPSSSYCGKKANWLRNRKSHAELGSAYPELACLRLRFTPLIFLRFF